MSRKPRRVDFYPDEMIAGVAGNLTATELGVLWMVSSLIYSTGGPIPEDAAKLARMFGDTHWRTVKSALDRLVGMGKLDRIDLAGVPHVASKRCASELQKAAKRIASATANGAQGGRPSNENNEIGKPNGSGDEKLTSNQQPATSNRQPSSSGPLALIDVVRSAICRAYGRAEWIPGKGKRSATDVAGAWLAAGMTPGRLAEIVGPICDRRVASGERAPTSLGYFDPAVREALAEAPPAAVQPHDPAARYRQPLDWWAGGRSWRLSGPEPDADPAGFRLAHPDCPAGLVAEAVQRRRAALAAGSGR